MRETQLGLTYEEGAAKAVSCRDTDGGGLFLNLFTFEKNYVSGGVLVYFVTLRNAYPKTIRDIKIAPDFGAKENAPEKRVLTLKGEAALFINGERAGGAPLSSDKEGLEGAFGPFSLPTLDNALLIFKTEVNARAPLAAGSFIENTVTATSPDLPGPVCVALRTVCAAYGEVVLFRTETPLPQNRFARVYTIYNYGNAEAGGAALTDTFDPGTRILSVEEDGVRTGAAGYSFVGKTLRFPAKGGVGIKAATFSPGPSGEVLSYPGKKVIEIKGAANKT